MWVPTLSPSSDWSWNSRDRHKLVQTQIFEKKLLILSPKKLSPYIRSIYTIKSCNSHFMSLSGHEFPKKISNSRIICVRTYIHSYILLWLYLVIILGNYVIRGPCSVGVHYRGVTASLPSISVINSLDLKKTLAGKSSFFPGYLICLAK